jgi:hypothetical protein
MLNHYQSKIVNHKKDKNAKITSSFQHKTDEQDHSHRFHLLSDAG